MLINVNTDKGSSKEEKKKLKISIGEQDDEVQITLKEIKERPFPVEDLISPRLASPRKIFDSVSHFHSLVLATTIIKEKHKLRIAYYCFRSWRVAYVAFRYCRMKRSSQLFTAWLGCINHHDQDTRDKCNLLKKDNKVEKLLVDNNDL